MTAWLQRRELPALAPVERQIGLTPLTGFAGVWGSARVYGRGEIVRYAGALHLCRRDGVRSTPGGDDWLLVLPRARDGVDGIDGADAITALPEDARAKFIRDKQRRTVKLEVRSRTTNDLLLTLAVTKRADDGLIEEAELTFPAVD